MDNIKKGLPVFVKTGKEKVPGTIINYGYSREGDYLNCEIELYRLNPLNAEIVRSTVKNVQSYKLSPRAWNSIGEFTDVILPYAESCGVLVGIGNGLQYDENEALRVRGLARDIEEFFAERHISIFYSRHCGRVKLDCMPEGCLYPVIDPPPEKKQKPEEVLADIKRHLELRRGNEGSF